VKKFLIINGPNLNMLGEREPEIYGDMSLEDIKNYTEKKLIEKAVELEWFQSNHEGEIVEKIQNSLREDYCALVINPAAYSHTSVAILDSLSMLSVPVVEVHISNTHLRESFRRRKLTAKASTIIMEGLGANSYYFAILSQLLIKDEI